MRPASFRLRIRTKTSVVASCVLVLVLLLGTLGLVTGCGSDTGGSTQSTNDTVSSDGVHLAASDLARVSAAAPRTDLLAAAHTFEVFGTDLYGRLAEGAKEGNLVFSPASVVTALVMTYAGAAGTTAEEMAATLHLPLQGDALHQAFNTLDQLLKSRSWEGKDSEGKDVGVLLRTANSLWAQKGLPFQKAFLDTLAANYGAGVRLVDYKTEAEKARRAINDWVSEQTEGKIPDLIPEGALNAMTRLVLANAVYLDATWAYQFDKAFTSDGPFTTLAGASVTTPLMRQSALFPYGEGEGWKAVELPYLREELALLLVVPDAGKFAQVEQQLGDGLLSKAVASLRTETEVDLTMPKFKFRTQAGLKEALMALGMKSAFSPEQADFSAMTAAEALYVDDVIHEAYIAVDEEGTEAAAATAVVMRATGAPAQQIRLVIDRPFLFALRDRDTGAILFLGRVTDPTA
jgi:serpin B